MSESLFLTLFDSVREGCQLIAPDWTYLYVNPAAARHGQSTPDALIGRKFTEVYPGVEETPLFARLTHCRDEQVTDEFENEFTFPDGSTAWFELRIQPVPAGLFILSIDISGRRRELEARRRIEEQIVAAQQLESIGRLAGGIAHDFNNLLSIIVNYADFVKAGIHEPEQALADVAEIRRAAKRAAALVRQLLAFSRRQVLQPDVINVNDVVGEIRSMIERLMGEDIDVRVVMASDLARAMLDRGQLEQVITNLAMNARDAMASGGSLVIETRNVELDSEYSESHLSVPPGSYVMLSVTDTGAGMTAETRDRIFEPFFSTKPAGRGTGLGLASVYGIVKQSGGSIFVYSELGRGTTFKLYFPVASGGERTGGRRLSGEIRVSNVEHQTILLVEDDAAVRETARRILSSAGYGVLAASHGKEALELLVANRAAVSAIVTDIVMPVMGGLELARRVAEIAPDLPVLFTSGYSEDAIEQRGGLTPDAAYVSKPFTGASLTQAVRRILANRPADSAE